MAAVLASAALIHTPGFAAPEAGRRFIEDRREAFEANAKNLLYVALTRARDRLVLEWPGFPERARGRNARSEVPVPCFRRYLCAADCGREAANWRSGLPNGDHAIAGTCEFHGLSDGGGDRYAPVRRCRTIAQYADVAMALAAITDHNRRADTRLARDYPRCTLAQHRQHCCPGHRAASCHTHLPDTIRPDHSLACGHRAG